MQNSISELVLSQFMDYDYMEVKMLSRMLQPLCSEYFCAVLRYRDRKFAISKQILNYLLNLG